MRRALLLPLLGLLAAAPALAGATASRGTSVGVSEREWRVSLYRTRVPVGVVRLNAHNYGEDGHDLAIRNTSGKVLGALPKMRPGGGRIALADGSLSKPAPGGLSNGAASRFMPASYGTGFTFASGNGPTAFIAARTSSASGVVA